MSTRTYASTSSPFFRLGTRRKLAGLLKIDMKKLRELSTATKLYSHFFLEKKNGGRRPVDNPRGDLKKVQRRIANLLSRITPPEFLFCPVKGRSYVSNAAVHRHSRVVHSIDVKTYFPSTPSRRIYAFFHDFMHCSPDVAAILAKLACCDGHLPTGSPLSPIMAYYAHRDIWCEAAALARAHNCLITIYIDDVTISGEHVPMSLVWRIKEIMHRGGLRYHKEKRAVDRRAEVTGVVIREGTLLIPNRQRVKLHVAKEQAHARPTDIKILGKVAGLRGQLRQIEAHNEAQAKVP